LLEIIEYSEAARGGEGDRRVNPEGGCRYFGEWYVSSLIAGCAVDARFPWFQMERVLFWHVNTGCCVHGPPGVKKRSTVLIDSGGCQLQPVPYQLQLAHKKTTVTKAYARFSGLSLAEMPPIQDTIGSPKQWGYRTKITPHFDAMPKFMQAALKGGSPPASAPAASAQGGAEEQEMNGQAEVDETDEVVGGCKHVRDVETAGAKEEGRGTKVIKVGEKEWELRIGFERKGRPGVMDIEVRYLHIYWLALGR
jgi:tRNA (uracil-5-)-methyltransferase